MTESNSGSMDVNSQPSTAHVFGLKRSGNHAIINWLTEGLASEYGICQSFNNVHDIWDMPDRLHEISTQEIVDKMAALAMGTGVVSYEDISYNSRHDIPQYKELAAGRIATIMILRDYPNMVASRIQRIRNLNEAGLLRPIQRIGWEHVRELWLEYANSVLDAGDLNDFIGVSYNKWFTSHNYRNAIAERIGFTNDDLSLNFVAETGMGSSFDGISYQGRAQQMDTLNRWRRMSGDAELNQLLNDPEVSSINEALFGFSFLNQ